LLEENWVWTANGGIERRAARWVVVVALGLARLGWAATGEDAGALLTPPQLEQPSPAVYPQPLLGSGVEGEVRLRLTISETGVVSHVEVESSPNPTLTGAATDAAEHLRFIPARLGDTPVAVILEYSYFFLASTVDGGLPEDGGAIEPFAELGGTVRSKGTREPVIGAQLEVDDGATAETDGTGHFTVRVTPGARTVTVKASGHQPGVFHENVEPFQRLDVLYRLLRSSQSPYETVVRSQADRAEVSRIQLAGPELKEVAGTRGEPLRVIMLLPGVASLASGLSYPVVRGSVPAATGFFLDGVRIPQLYHLAVGPAVVHPEFIDAIDFYPANAPSSFGNLTAGVVAASVREPRERVHVEGSVDIINAGAFAEVPIPSTGTNVTVAGRVSYTGWLLALVTKAATNGDVTPVADFYDYQARVEQKVGKASLRLLAFGSSDLVGARPKDPQSVATFLTSRFHRVDLRARVPLGPGKLEAGATVGWEDLGIYAEQSGQRAASFLLGRFILSARAQWWVELAEHLSLRVAGDLERQVASIDNTTTISPGAEVVHQPAVMGVISGVSAEVSWSPSRLALVAGLRGASFHAQPGVQFWALEPRLSARFALTDFLTLKGGAGLFHQPPTLLLSLPISDLASLKDGLQETIHLALGAEARLFWGLELGVEAFFNPMTQVREKSLTQFITGNSTYEDKHGASFGRAYGLEVLLRSPARGRFFGWISYSLMRSERLRTFPVFGADGEVLEVRKAYLPFAFDQTHNLNVVAGYQLPLGYRLSGTFHFNTGRPESGEVSSRTMVPSTNAQGLDVWRPVSLDQVARLPPFFRFDARVSKEWTLRDLLFELYLDLFNISLSQEVYVYDYGRAYDTNPPGPGALEKRATAFPVFSIALGLKGTY